MLQLKRAIVACLLASALLSTVATHAATYYVATTGNNSNPGTSSQPWQTVAYAVDKMVAGDTTYVKGGTYYGHVRFKRSGTQSAPIKLLNAPGQFPVIDCKRTKSHMVLLQNNSGFQYPIGWITIEGFEIRNCHDGIKYYNLHDSTIRRNWIHHSLYQGILGQGGTRVLIDRNKINHNGGFASCATTPSVCNQHHGIYAHGSYTSIINNLIYDNLGFGITQNCSSTSSYSSAKHAGPEFAGAKYWTISNNTFAYNVYRGGIVLWGSQCSNTRIENNLFYENSVKSFYSPNGIEFSSFSSTGITIRNNLAFASGSGGKDFLKGATQGYTQTGSIVNTLNPKFVNAPATLPSSPNFSLTSGSPAIDKGLTATTKTSYPGTTRPQYSGYDIGAYEYYSSTQIAAPTSLQATN